MPSRDLSDKREVYQFGVLDMADCHADPFVQFDVWFLQAVEANLFEPNAMTLATAGKDNQPSARTLLLKGFSHDGFVFYTNYESKKGSQMSENEKAAMLFWWREQERQVRIEGTVSKTDRIVSENYFHSRPQGSQLAASVSPQSKMIAGRIFLDEKMKELEERYKDGEVPLPENWGGYILKPVLFEFWQGRTNRLHDRIEYVQVNGHWEMRRLAP
jgi:pyridoxamine 5'-phosphate oxidase